MQEDPGTNDAAEAATSTDPGASDVPLPATPTIRQFAVLEAMARLECHFTLHELVQETGLPKPTVHRMLQQLEGAGIVQRDGDERHYGLGTRMRRLANGLLANDSLHGARHRILLGLRERIGESCNLTALSGSDVVYLDRVETFEPLRFSLHPGSRVPLHCSATGKLFLSRLPPRQRRLLLGDGPLARFTPSTITSLPALDAELARCRREGHAFDNEEYLPGLVCLAVLVPSPQGRSNLGLAMQGPVMRLSSARLAECLPALQEAARALAALEDTPAEPRIQGSSEQVLAAVASPERAHGCVAICGQ